MPEQQALKPQFFVTRQNGTMVPLIAMDELPIHVQIRNVPRILDPYTIAGMMGVGVFESRHRYYVVEALNNTKSLFLDSIHAPPSAKAQAASPNLNEIIRAASIAKSPVLPPVAPPKEFGIGKQPSGDATSSACTSSNDSIPGKSKLTRNDNSTNHLPTGAAIMLDSKPAPAAKGQENAGQIKAPVGSKEYCSFWIRRGECDYAQQGCVYKHEMPLDLRTLERIGHRDIPRWYREKYGLGSLLVAGGKSGPSYGVSDPSAAERKWRVSDDAKRMIRHGLGAVVSGQGTRQNSRNNNKSHSDAKSRALEASKAREQREKDKQRQKELIALTLDEVEEKERKALAAKYKTLRPDHRSIFDHDLDSDTFSNGQEADDLMAKIRAREQAGWEKEKAEARSINASVATRSGSGSIIGKQAHSGKEQRGAKRRGGGQRRKNEAHGR